VKWKSSCVSPGLTEYRKGVECRRRMDGVDPKSDEAMRLRIDAERHFKCSSVTYRFAEAYRALVLNHLDALGKNIKFDDAVKIEPIIGLMSMYWNSLILDSKRCRVIERIIGPYFLKINNFELESLVCLLLALDFSDLYHPFVTLNSSRLTENVPTFKVDPNPALSQWLFGKSSRHQSSHSNLLATAAVLHDYARYNEPNFQNIKKLTGSFADNQGHPEELRAFSLFCLREYVVLRNAGGKMPEFKIQKELALRYMMEYLRVVCFEGYPISEPFKPHLKSLSKISIPFIKSTDDLMYRGFAEYLIADEFKGHYSMILKNPFLKSPSFCIARSNLKYNVNEYFDYWMLIAIKDNNQMALHNAEPCILETLKPITARSTSINRI